MKGNGPDIHELTRIEAYLLSEKAGHPSHMHDYFWTQAEAIVRQRVAIVDFAVKATEEPPVKTGKSTKAKPKPAASKVKKSPDAQLLLGDETAMVKPTKAAPKPKSAAPAKKKAVPAVSKATAKPVSNSK